MTVKAILSRKGNDVVTIKPTTTLGDAVKILDMSEEGGLASYSVGVADCPLLMLWTAPTLRHQSAKGWSREANHVEGSRPWARLSHSVLI